MKPRHYFRQVRRTKGICVYCPLPSIRFSACRCCRDLRNTERRGNERYIGQTRRAMELLRERRRAAGLCIQCGKFEALSRCGVCKEYNRETNQRARERERIIR